MVINGKIIPYPSSFTMKKSPNIVASITTMSGKDIADVNGWKYDDTTLKWETMYPTDLENLISALEEFEFSVTFIEDSSSKTVNAILKGFDKTKLTCEYSDGGFVYKDIQVSLSFPDCYQ